jgi:hypothetical protein
MRRNTFSAKYYSNTLKESLAGTENLFTIGTRKALKKGRAAQTQFFSPAERTAA